MRRYDPASEDLPVVGPAAAPQAPTVTAATRPARRDAGSFARRVAVLLLSVIGVLVYYCALLLRPPAPQAGVEKQPAGGNGFWDVSAFRQDRGDRASRWDHLDWLPPKSRSKLHTDFPSQRKETPQWDAGERKISCGVPEADEANRLGADMMYRHLSHAYIHPVKDLKQPLAVFRRGLKAAPECATSRVNYCIVAMANAADSALLDVMEECRAYLDGVPPHSPLRAKALLWMGLIAEQLEKAHEAHDLYHAAFAKSPVLARQYFGKPPGHWKQTQRPCTFFRDARMANQEARKIQKKTLRLLLMYGEFAQYFGWHQHYTKQDADDFIDVWYTHVRHMLPPWVVKVLQDCYRGILAMGALKFNDVQSKRWYHYNDPVVRFLSSTYNDFVSHVSDQPTKITYTYMGAYPGGSQLPPHVDRAQCEWTLSVSIDVNPSDQVCALALKKEPKRLSKERSHGKNTKPTDPAGIQYVYPHQGDGILFRGRGLVHWRDPIPEHMNCTNLFLHYVLEDHVGKQD
eukprot:Hpha_TRINITY_DN34351_c0_g1::TRINITY_DN34351_c0_g1_i1::g.109552::m.109552